MFLSLYVCRVKNIFLLLSYDTSMDESSVSQWTVLLLAIRMPPSVKGEYAYNCHQTTDPFVSRPPLIVERQKCSQSHKNGPKTKSWQEFAATLDPATPSSHVWQVIPALDDRAKAPLRDTPSSHARKTATSDKRKADMVMAVYAEVSRLKVSREDNNAAYTRVRAPAGCPHDRGL